MTDEVIDLHRSWQQRVRDCLAIIDADTRGPANNIERLRLRAHHKTARRELLKIGLMVDKAIATKGFTP